MFFYFLGLFVDAFLFLKINIYFSINWFHIVLWRGSYHFCQIGLLYLSADTLFCWFFCLLIYLISSLVDYVFFTTVIIVCVIFLDFAFLPIVCFPIFFSLSLVSYSGILFLWPEVGPDLLGCQHWVQDHGLPENSWLQWILFDESPHECLNLNLRPNSSQPPALPRVDASHHTTSKTETQTESLADRLAKVRRNLYTPAKDTNWHGSAIVERRLRCGHNNITSIPYPSKATQDTEPELSTWGTDRSKNYRPAPWEEKTINIVR